MRNAGLEEAQAGIKIAWKSLNNLRDADDTTLKAELSVVWLSIEGYLEKEENSLI